jgi:outer membrane protein OmpA-like peptidoglycan-associated protein
MFAPPVAKPKAMPPKRSAFMAQRPDQSAANQAYVLQPSVGTQAMFRLPAQRATAIGKVPGTHGNENDATRMAGQDAAPSWNFSKIPIFPPGRADRFQMPRSLAARRLPAPIQAKLKIGPVDDPLEHEADRVADQVMRVAAEGIALTSAPPQVSRKCGACESEQEENLQRKEAGTSLDRQADSGASSAAGSGLNGLLGSGAPLAPGVRGFFESRFGRSFGDVRVHADHEADTAARSIDALAFTVGRDVVFSAGAYSPDTQSGRRLLAHELTHVVQQHGSGPWIQRAPTCPARPSGEAAQSRTPAGILATNVALASSTISQLDIRDFAVGSANLPPGTTSDPQWQRALSIMTGDPSIKIQVTAFTDCAGSDAENVSLRQDRADTVVSALPGEVRGKILFNIPISTSTFIDTNETPEGRARNRAVRVSFASAPPRGTDPCDMLSRAANIDEYIFLVHCLETRLKLTAPAEAPKALSALRQIYFGTGSWSLKPHSVWGSVIESPAWNPGADPTPQLGPSLMAALKASDVIGQIDVSHVMTGIEAMMSPHNVEHLPGLITATTVPNEEWATWAGDVGSAAAEWVVDTVFTAPATPLRQKDYFTKFAGDDDLRGNLDAFAMREGFNTGGAPSSHLMQAIRLTGTLSEDLRQYYRLTGSTLGLSRAHATRDFIEAYGGTLSGATVTNRAALAVRLRPSVSQFANLFMAAKLLKRGFFGNAPRPPGAPLPNGLIDPAVDAMTDFFISWLEQHP